MCAAPGCSFARARLGLIARPASWPTCPSGGGAADTRMSSTGRLGVAARTHCHTQRTSLVPPNATASCGAAPARTRRCRWGSARRRREVVAVGGRACRSRTRAARCRSTPSPGHVVSRRQLSRPPRGGQSLHGERVRVRDCESSLGDLAISRAIGDEHRSPISRRWVIGADSCVLRERDLFARRQGAGEARHRDHNAGRFCCLTSCHWNSPSC
jgi:hypothetical protein